jgi:signal peptidase I
MPGSERVCPSCGDPAGHGTFCEACGANLSLVDRLPTRAEWEADRESRAAAEHAHQTAERAREAERATARDRRSRRGARARRVAVPLAGLVLIVGAGTAVASALRPDMRAMRIPSESMQPTLRLGERVTVNEGAYDRGQRPRLGDLVAFHPPAGAEDGTCGSGPPPAGQVCDRPTENPSGMLFYKRVVAGPGDRVAVDNGYVILDGTRQQEDFAGSCGGGSDCHFPREVTVPDDHYFMMGDNRGASDDSRFWGPVPSAWMIGRIDTCSRLGFACAPRR